MVGIRMGRGNGIRWQPNARPSSGKIQQRESSEPANNTFVRRGRTPFDDVAVALRHEPKTFAALCRQSKDFTSNLLAFATAFEHYARVTPRVAQAQQRPRF